MFLHVKEARYLHDYVIWLRFNDGAEGEIDLQSELDGEVFSPLRDKCRFRRFQVDPELETIVWENGADLAPEFLCENMIAVDSLRDWEPLERRNPPCAGPQVTGALPPGYGTAR